MGPAPALLRQVRGKFRDHILVKLPVAVREKELKLEQLRALDAGMKIAVVRVDGVPLGVDTPTELEIARRLLKPKF